MDSQHNPAPCPDDVASDEQAVGGVGCTAGSLAYGNLSNSYVPEVDALRCVAMTAVIAFHCALFPAGWMGVWLFFVISGFAVTTSLFATKHRALSNGSRIATFYARRALRIWPIYFLFIAINAVVIFELGRYRMLRELPWLLTFTQNVRMFVATDTSRTSWTGFAHLWTLSVEQQFYLVLPLLLFLPSRSSRSLILFAVLAVAPLIRLAVGRWAVAHGYNDLGAASVVYAFGPDHFDAFAVGSLIAMFREEITRNKRLAHLAAYAAGTLTIVYVAVYIIINFSLLGHLSGLVVRNIVSGVMYGQGREIWAYFVPTSVSTAIIMCILADVRGCRRICRLPGLQAIGRISYGGYLFHVPVLMILAEIFRIGIGKLEGPGSYGMHILLFLSTYIITIVAAWFSFEFLERRFSRLGRANA